MTAPRPDSAAPSGPTPGPSGAATPAMLAAEARSCLANLLAERPPVLLDVPSHPNVGDSAIWLGERALLAALDRRPALECDVDTFDPDGLRPAVRGRTVLIHGGGNLGDLWPTHQALRERAIAAFRDRPVLQLPQTVCFRSEAALARARRVFAAHPDLTLLCRDDRSVEIARRSFDGACVVRCPDLALCLPREVLDAHRAPRPMTDILWLMRTDRESAWPDTSFPADTRDWLRDHPSPAGVVARWLRTRLRRRPGAGPARALHGRVLARAAEGRVRRGIRLLSSARVVVTDRLHAHILCALLEIPHVVLDDAFGKIDAHLATWPGLAPLARRAADPVEAHETARALLEEAA